MNHLVEYIKYRCKAKKRHGIHSPFVYGISDVCLRQNIDNHADIIFRKVRNYYKFNDEIIVVHDLGAGSYKLDRLRNVRDIYKISSSKGKYGIMLYQLVHYFQANSILELGTSIGVGTTFLKAGNLNARITTLEGCPETARVASELFRHLGWEDIDQRIGAFQDVLPDLSGQSYDLIFLDGHHDGTATLQYVNQLIPMMHDDTVLILDDIRWSHQMFDAWNQLIEDNRFNVSIDLYREGILMKRSIQLKEHFTLRP